MGLQIFYGSSVIVLPKRAVEDPKIGKTELMLLSLLASDSDLLELDSDSRTKLKKRLSLTESELDESIAKLTEAGILEDAKSAPKKRKAKPSPRDEAPSYSGNEIAEKLEAPGSPLKALIDECAEICGKIFNPTEIGRIVALHDYLGLSPEQILLMFEYYKSKGDATGRKISVPYIEKAAYALFNDGIDTAEKFEAFVREREDANSTQNKIRRLFGMGDRAFTAKEKEFISKWTKDWETPFELIEHAYGITLDNTGKLSMPYMTKIISGWHDAGIKTVDDAAKASEAFKENRGTPDVKSGFDTDSFFEKAVKRSYEAMKNQNSSDGGQNGI